LLYLDGWPVGTPEYPQRHLEAYRAAREKFHERTIVLIGDTGRDHGGKARLVLPEALEDGFQVLLWGKLTLLGRFRPAEIRDAVPRVGPPIPSEASFDEAIRLHQEEYLWEAQEHYSEKLWKSRTLLMNEGRLSPVPPASRDYFGLPEKRNLYLCFQNPLKIHPDFDPLLRGILEADPKATIALLSGTRGAAAAVLKERFHQTVGPQADRIVFLPWLKFQDYCCLLALADVVLDPPHYTASSSAYDILSFSQPTVTLPGELAVGRMGRGFHHKMHTEELVARTPEEYVATAVRVGADRDYRQCLRDRIRSASDAVFNDVEAVREHERFFAEAQPVDRRL
jgi:hypothetical protein